MNIAIDLPCIAAFALLWFLIIALLVAISGRPGKIPDWKYDESKRSRTDKFLRGEAPFKKGDIVVCDVTVYNFRKGELYTIRECFETKGFYGWHWWIYADEVPVSSFASDFHLADNGARL